MLILIKRNKKKLFKFILKKTENIINSEEFYFTFNNMYIIQINVQLTHCYEFFWKLLNYYQVLQQFKEKLHSKLADSKREKRYRFQIRYKVRLTRTTRIVVMVDN